MQTHPNVITTQYKDTQGRLSTPWVEIGDRIVGTGMTNVDWLAFLRLVKGLRRCEGLQCRGEGGLFQSKVAPIDMAAKLLDINLRSAREVHAQFQKTKELPEGSNRGNYERILDLDAKFGHRTMLCWVRLICVQYAARDERLTYRCMIEELKSKVTREWGDRATEAVLGAITIKKMSTWCKNNGYRTVDLRGKKTIGESAEQNAKCAKFCRLMHSSLANPAKLQVYQDESYVNEKHARNQSLANPDDEETVPCNTKKGRRHCFSDAITKYGEVPGARWIFCPNKDQQKKKDYHASFNAENFYTWFTNTLIPACENAFGTTEFGETVTFDFIMDNAGYHINTAYKIPQEGGPDIEVKRNASKPHLFALLQTKGRNPDPNMTKAELQVLFDRMRDEEGCDLQRFARSRGHEVIFTPPRASRWQPIELFWAHVKNKVASQWVRSRSLEQTRQQLVEAMDEFGTKPGHCASLIDKSLREIREYHSAIEQEDRLQPRDQSSEDESGNSSESSLLSIDLE